MDSEHHDEWYALREMAYGQLRAGVGGEPSFRLQVLDLPSFEDQHAFEVCASDDGGQAPMAVHATWRMKCDLEKFATPLERLAHPPSLEPTIQVRSALLSRELYIALRAEAEGVRVPQIASSKDIVLDGAWVEFYLKGPSSGVEVRWHGDAPGAWDEIARLAGRVRRLVEETVG